MKTTINPNGTDGRLVEAEGFRDGANGVPAQPALDEIAALFARQQAEAREKVSGEIKSLEARARTLRPLAEEAQARWEALKQDYGIRSPRLLLPFFLLALSAFAVLAEAILLAPTMDMFGIADPVRQLAFASAIVLIAALIFHQYLEHRDEATLGLILAILAIATAGGLVTLGLMRSNQLAFAASLSGNSLGEFLKLHPRLRDAVFIFLTLFFPVAASLTFHRSTNQMHEWWQFSKARRQARKFARAANDAEKQLESKQEQLDEQLKQLDEFAKEWHAAYLTHHELGATVGAQRPPRWTIWAKATAAALATFALACVVSSLLGPFGPFTLAIGGLLGAGVWLLSAAYFYRQWEHPSALQYLRWARLRFHEDEATRPVRAVMLESGPTTRLPERPLAELTAAPEKASRGR